jgi:hypothetical protein
MNAICRSVPSQVHTDLRAADAPDEESVVLGHHAIG